MTDRHAGYVLTLDRDIREDDAKHIISLLEHIVGVLKVEPVISTPALQMAHARARAEIESKVWKALRDE